VKGHTPTQRDALRVVADLLEPGAAYLAGGVAVAARLGHRLSIDLDIFVSSGAPEDLSLALASRGDVAKVLSRSKGSLHAEILGVPVSILRYPYALIGSTEYVDGLALPLASVEDLVAMKLSAIANRGARRDFWDFHALCLAKGWSLDAALDLYRRKFPNEDLGHVVRALSYFGDAESEPMLPGLNPDAWTRLKRDVRTWVASLA